MKLFPYILVRVSGGGFEQLETLNAKDSFHQVKEIFQIKEQLKKIKEKISDELYQFIPQEKDHNVQNLLLNCRRDIFNERDIPTDKLDNIIAHLPKSLNEDLKNYLRIKKTMDRLCAEGETVFSREVPHLRENLHTLAREDTLQKGLLLGSQSLLKRVPAYVAKKSGLNKKDFQTERGLIKYISRMYGKTSPFSTFTNLVMGKPVPSTQAPAEDVNGKNPFLWLPADVKEKKVICHIRLNNFLYSYLKILLCKNPEIYRHFLIRPNPTLKQGEDHYLFLTNNDNIEAFQRIPANPVLEVFRYLTAEKKEGIPMRELIRSIIKNEYIDAPEEELEAYIVQLIEYGFLEYNIGVSGIDPDWDIKLRQVLTNIISDAPNTDIPLLGELSETLKNIRTLAGQYGEAPCNKRNQILEEAFQQCRAICMKLHEAARLPEEERKTPEERMKAVKEERKKAEQEKDPGKSEGENQQKQESEEKKEDSEEVFKHQSNTYFYFKPEQMFYEDATVDITLHVDETGMMEFIGELHKLLQLVKHYEGMQDEREKMQYFFKHQYDENASIPLMTFYEEYYREFKKPEAELQRKQEAIQRQQQQKQEKQQNEAQKEEGAEAEEIKLTEEEEKKAAFLAVPSIKERQERNSQWTDHYKEILKKEITPDPDFIFLSPHQVVQAHREYDTGMSRGDGDRSYGSFVQFYKEKKADGEEKLMGVLNASFPGFGKLFSRFLHIFDDSITGDMRKWNETCQGDALLAEDTDASYFNANLHPPLLPYEVRIPGGHNTLPSEKQIPITELLVKLDETGKRLQLIHEPSKKRVYVIDLGFQGHKGRSQLFQLLEKFSRAEYLFPMPLVNAAMSIARPEQTPAGEKKEQIPGIRVSPRVVYDNRIVLQRKGWQIPVELLPFKEPGESSWAYFVRVNQWRHELQMPDEVFVNVVERMMVQIPPKAKPKAKQNPTRDDYKPQYISFKNPFLIDLFEKLIKRVAYSLKVVEMLPNSQHLLKVGENRHITEFTIQWYTYAQSE
jgi:hypothetical protein